MVTLLSKLWIKSDNYKDSKVREKYGVLCGAVGIFLNVLLFLGKFFAGLVSGAISITADAFNNLSDAGSSFVSMIGFKLSGRKPDPDHPFGHGKKELMEIKIDPEVVDPEDIETLEDLIISAVNEAFRAQEEDYNNNMSKISGGMGLGGLPF